MKKTILILCLVLFISYGYASVIPQPPLLRDLPYALTQYLKKISDNFNRPEEVTTNPDGSRTGRYRETVLFNDSGTYYLEVCVSSPSGTTWKGVALSDTP